jgi:hypothetical protein
VARLIHQQEQRLAASEHLLKVLPSSLDELLHHCVELSKTGGLYQFFKLAFVEIVEYVAMLRGCYQSETIKIKCTDIPAFWARPYKQCLQAARRVVAADARCSIT